MKCVVEGFESRGALYPFRLERMVVRAVGSCPRDVDVIGMNESGMGCKKS